MKECTNWAIMWKEMLGNLETTTAERETSPKTYYHMLSLIGVIVGWHLTSIESFSLDFPKWSLPTNQTCAVNVRNSLREKCRRDVTKHASGWSRFSKWKRQKQKQKKKIYIYIYHCSVHTLQRNFVVLLCWLDWLHFGHVWCQKK